TSVSEDATTGNLVTTLLAGDTDPDASDVLRVTAVNTSGTLGAVTFNAGAVTPGDETVTYAADHNSFDSLAVGESTTDTFSYTVSDGNGSSDMGAVTVVINGVTDPVTADDDSTSVSEDATTGNLVTTLLAGDTDPDASDVLRV